MQNCKQDERGSLMVEVLAVVALLGLVGTVLYRQIDNRNKELDNINMASETRMVKEAVKAYIQANHAWLEEQCRASIDDGYCELGEVDDDTRSDIDLYMPAYAACYDGDGNCLLNNYDIYMSGYVVDADLSPRVALYATIKPNYQLIGGLKRAARIANLIGTDGGVFDGEDGSTLYGTMGAWETACPWGDCDQGDGAYFVATTGMDIYIPETENNADNVVAFPKKLALTELHGANYLSVGGNCVTLTEGGYFLHEAGIKDGKATDDSVKRVGTDLCDPLFWVGSVSGVGSDKSEAGQVYMKNGLYIGRDNANDKQAIALEKTKVGAGKITVFDETGDERLVLNASGKIVGRTNDVTGKGFQLDAKSGSLILFEEKNVTIGGESRRVQVQNTRIKDGVLETGIEYTYKDDAGNNRTENFKVDPAYTSVMNDIRLASRGGARLSDILPDYILKGMHTVEHCVANNSGVSIPKPPCPAGYTRAITFTLTSFPVGISDITLDLPPVTVNPNGEDGSVTVDPAAVQGLVKTTGNNVIAGVNGSPLQVTQIGYPWIKITDDNSNWNIQIFNENDLPNRADCLDGNYGLAQTYCVFSESNINAEDGLNGFGLSREAFEAPDLPDADRGCTSNTDCTNTETCVSNVCTPLGTCTKSDGSFEGGNVYCIDGQKVYMDCGLSESDTCEDGKNCVNYRCE